MELINFDNVASVLEEYAVAVRNKYQDNLIENDRISSGKLLNGAEYKVDFDGTEYVVSLDLQKYWKYIEKGVRGEKNPMSPYANPGWKAYPHILKWISVKPVIPRPMANGQLPTPQQLAGMITSKIVKNGTEGSDDLHDALDEVNAIYKDKLIIALDKDLSTMMKVIVGDFKGTIGT